MIGTTSSRLGILALLSLCLSCNSIKDKVDQIGQEPWPENVHLQVLGARQVFDKNWEVKFKIENDGDGPFSLQELTEKQAKLVLSDGSRRSLHPISFGIKKPLKLAPHEHKSSALLFRASDSKPEAILLKGKRFPVSSPSGA
jgi:uncharacterized membrane protein YfhO